MLSLYSSQPSSWYSDYPYTHHSLPGGTHTFPILMTVCLVVLRLSLSSSQSPCWYSDYPYSHHSLPGGTQTIPISSQPPWWYSGYPNTHHSLPGGTQTIHIHIPVCLVVPRLSLYSSQSPCLVLKLSLYTSQSPWWYSDYR